jgi:hypothetical protein
MSQQNCVPIGAPRGESATETNSKIVGASRLVLQHFVQYPQSMLLPLCVTLLLGTFQCARAMSISLDSAIFIRYARQLGGEPAPPKSAELRLVRGHLASFVVSNLRASISGFDAIEFEHQHPGYPLALLVVQRVLGPLLSDDPALQWIRSGQLASLLGGCMLTVGSYFLGRRLLSETAGLAGAVVLATAVPFVQTYCDVLSDIPGLACLVISTLFAARLLEGGNWSDALCCGVFAGVGYLIRPEEVQVAMLATLVLLVRFACGTPDTRSHTLINMVSILAPILALCAPYVLIKGSILTKKAHIYGGNAYTPVPIAPSEAEQFEQKESPTLILGDLGLPGSAESRAGVMRGLGEFFFGWSRDLGHFLFVPVLVGLASSLGILRKRPSHRLVWGVFLINAVSLPLILFRESGYLDRRHVMPTVILTIPWCWPGLIVLGNWTRWLLLQLTTWFRRHALLRMVPWAHGAVAPRRFAIGTLALCVMANCALGAMRPLNAQRFGVRRAGDWLRHHVAADCGIIDPENLAGTYAGLDARNYWDRFPRFTIGHLSSILHRGPHVSYLVLSDRYLRNFADTAEIPDRIGDNRTMKMVRFPSSTDPADSDGVCIYKLVREQGAN